GADPTDWLCPTIGKPQAVARVREVWVAGRKLLASLYQQMRDPSRVVGIDGPRDANEPAQASRVAYRHDSYGFDSGTHGRSLRAGTQRRKRGKAIGITTHCSRAAKLEPPDCQIFPL